MASKAEMRELVEDNIAAIRTDLNNMLRTPDTTRLTPIFERLGRSRRLPHWYEQFSQDGSFPNLDGKTVGSVIEMLLVAVLETAFLSGHVTSGLTINPARGVDLPDLELSVKSPSENYCTSEPFFSPYERIIGSEYDAIVLLTDYQKAKKSRPLKLQILRATYLHNSQLADYNLCRIAKMYRSMLAENEPTRLKRIVRFLAYVNQSDWRAGQLLQLLDGEIEQERIKTLLKTMEADFLKKNKERNRKANVPLPESDLASLKRVGEVQPPLTGIVEALDDWVVEAMKDFGRAPNDSEWARFEGSKLDGCIGMSFALQWRFNFSRTFTGKEIEVGDPVEALECE
jgi:hypothetical protein